MTNSLCLILLILTISTSSCRKRNAVPKLKGEWELRTELNRKTGTSINYLPGNGTIMKFTGTDYEMYSHEKFVKSGKYFIEDCNSNLNQGSAERIVYDSDSYTASVNEFVRADSTLSIFPDTNKNVSVIYKKIKS